MRWLTPVTPWVVLFVSFIVTSFITYYSQIEPLSKADAIIISDEGVSLRIAEGRTISLGESIRTTYISGFFPTFGSMLLALLTEILRRRRKK